MLSGSSSLQKALILGGGLGLAMGIIGLIPCVGCINLILMFLPGVLIAHFIMADGEQLSIGSGAQYGALGGVCSVLGSAVIFVPYTLIFGMASMQQQMSQMPDNPMAAMMVGPGMIIVLLIVVVIEMIVSAAINAVTGLIYVAIKNR